MNAAKRLKIIAVVMFCFIVVLVSLLIYVVKVAGDSKASSESSAAATTSVSQNAGSSKAAGTSQSGNSSQNTDSSKDSGVASGYTADTETIDLKLYYYDANDYDNPKEIRTVQINKKQFQEDLTSAINTLLSSTGLTVNSAVLNEKNMKIDIPKDTAKKFNSGSAGGITNTNILAMTVLNLPGIEKLQVTVDGELGVESDHFSFNGTFVKSQDGKKYDFIPSDSEGKLLDIK